MPRRKRESIDDLRREVGVPYWAMPHFVKRYPDPLAKLREYQAARNIDPPDWDAAITALVAKIEADMKRFEERSMQQAIRESKEAIRKRSKTMPDIKLDKLRELKDDWDNDGASAPTEEAIDAAERVLNMLRDVPGAAVPTTDGGVQIEWHARGFDIEFVITPEGTFQLE